MGGVFHLPKVGCFVPKKRAMPELSGVCGVGYFRQTAYFSVGKTRTVIFKNYIKIGVPKSKTTILEYVVVQTFRLDTWGPRCR
jgi:hypothetical protein